MILKTKFDSLVDDVIANTKTYSFNLKDLPIYNKDSSIREHEVFSNMFEELDNIKNHCLYWFELADEESCESLIIELNSKRKSLKEKIRVVPVMNKNTNSKVLYVGSRRGGYTKKWNLSNISGRIIQHLGHYEKGTTQGLQLAYWAINQELIINVNVAQFEEGLCNEHLGALEKIMACNLKPLCGKH